MHIEIFLLFIVIVIIMIIYYYYNNDKAYKESFVVSDAIIYVLYHDDLSFKTAQLFEKYEWAQLNKLGGSIFFENAFFPILQSKVSEWENKQYVGLVSYNIVKKQNLKYFPLSKIIEKGNNADVIALFKYSGRDLISQATLYHPKFLDIWYELLLKMNYKSEDILSDKIPMFPCNCWIAKPEWMKRYIEFVNVAMHLLENDEKLKRMVYDDSGYKSNLSKKKLTSISGKPYYTYHPFILERLPCFYFWVNDAKVYNTNVGIPSMNY